MTLRRLACRILGHNWNTTPINNTWWWCWPSHCIRCGNTWKMRQ